MRGIDLGRFKRFFIRVAMGLVFVLTTHISFGAPPVIPSAVKASIRSRVNNQYTPGMIVGMVNADGRAFYGYGGTSFDADQSPDEHTVYEIGSISKILTTSLLADLWLAGEVSLDDLVQDYLPEGVNVPTRSGREITLEHLATHFSGLPTNPETIFENDSTNPFFPFSDLDLYDYLNHHTLARRPGQSFEYSNLGMGLLGHALALGQNQSFESLLKDRILNPLGMNETVITWDESKNAQRAIGYSGVVERPFFKMEVLEAAGSVLSTVTDLLTFAEYQIGLKDSPLNNAFKEAHKKRVNAGSPGVDLGLGWFILSNTPSPLLFHDGATLGHNSFIGIDMAKQTAVVVLTNARVNAYSGVQDIGINLLVPQSPLTSIRRPIELETKHLQSIYGTYQGTADRSVNIGLERNHLTVEFSEDLGTLYTFYPLSSRRFMFYDATTEASANFLFDDNDKPIELTWRQNGQSISYQRVTKPAQLRLLGQSESIQLDIEDGDGATTYEIQATRDFQTWTSLGPLTLWDSPVALDQQDTYQFFRAVAPDSDDQ